MNTQDSNICDVDQKPKFQNRAICKNKGMYFVFPLIKREINNLTNRSKCLIKEVPL